MTFRNKSLKSAFTLVEIMIVIAIIGLLLAIAIPSFMNARVRSELLEKLRDANLSLPGWVGDLNYIEDKVAWFEAKTNRWDSFTGRHGVVWFMDSPDGKFHKDVKMEGNSSIILAPPTRPVEVEAPAPQLFPTMMTSKERVSFVIPLSYDGDVEIDLAGAKIKLDQKAGLLKVSGGGIKTVQILP